MQIMTREINHSTNALRPRRFKLLLLLNSVILLQILYHVVP